MDHVVFLQEERKVVEICEGDQVYVEKEGEVEAGAVSKVDSQLQYEVSFEDGSICNNLSPADILVSQHLVQSVGGIVWTLPPQNPPCSPPPHGARLKVRWSDGEIYSAKILGHHSAPLYTVGALSPASQTGSTWPPHRWSVMMGRLCSCLMNTSTQPKRSCQEMFR